LKVTFEYAQQRYAEKHSPVKAKTQDELLAEHRQKFMKSIECGNHDSFIQLSDELTEDSKNQLLKEIEAIFPRVWQQKNEMTGTLASISVEVGSD
jgi:hypothetical protein